MSLKYELASEPLHIYVKWLFGTDSLGRSKAVAADTHWGTLLTASSSLRPERPLSLELSDTEVYKP